MLLPEQRELRKKYLGSSDMAAIVGLDKWSNISDVYLEKTGQLELEPAKENGNLPAEIGQIFEDAVCQLFAKIRGVTLEKNIFLHHGIFCSNLDRFITADHEIVEAKTHGDPDDYGEQYTDEIPESQIIQVHEQFYVVSEATNRECKVAWVPVLLPGYKSLQFRIYKVTRNDKLMNDLVALGNNFWNEHVIPHIPPEPYQPSLDIIKRIKRVPKTIADIPDTLIAEWQEAAALEEQAKQLLDGTKSRLLVAIGNCEAGETEGGRMVTYFEQQRGRSEERRVGKECRL